MACINVRCRNTPVADDALRPLRRGHFPAGACSRASTTEEEEEVVDAQKLEICRAVNEPLLKAIGFFSSSEDSS